MLPMEIETCGNSWKNVGIGGALGMRPISPEKCKCSEKIKESAIFALVGGTATSHYPLSRIAVLLLAACGLTPCRRRIFYCQFASAPESASV